MYRYIVAALISYSTHLMLHNNHHELHIVIAVSYMRPPTDNAPTQASKFEEPRP